MRCRYCRRRCGSTRGAVRHINRSASASATRETSFQWWQSAFERLAARLPACSRAFREVTTAPGRPWRTSSTTVCARTPDVAPSRRSLVITLSENHSVITFQWGGACFEVVVHAYLTIACIRGMRSARPAQGAQGRPMGALREYGGGAYSTSGRVRPGFEPSDRVTVASYCSYNRAYNLTCRLELHRS